MPGYMDGIGEGRSGRAFVRRTKVVARPSGGGEGTFGDRITRGDEICRREIFGRALSLSDLSLSDFVRLSFSWRGCGLLATKWKYP